MTKITLQMLERQEIAEGATFGEAGTYERILARAHLRVDPAAAPNKGVVDLDKAPRDADGLVKFATDVQILRPVDLARGNRRLFVELVNRGNKRCLQFFNDAPGSLSLIHI